MVLEGGVDAEETCAAGLAGRDIKAAVAARLLSRQTKFGSFVNLVQLM